MSRRRNGGYWTVRYIDENGLFFNVGNFASRKMVLDSIITNPYNYPPGEGKVVFIK